MSRSAAGTIGKRRLLAGASLMLALLSCLVSSGLAANYTVSNGTDLNNAIAAANGDPDATATIKLANSFSTVGNLPSATKPITIDTQGFTLSGIQMLTTNGQILTFTGTIVGNTGQRGINLSSGNASSLKNDGSITGGANGTSTTSAGVNLGGPTTFVNNGAVTGGSNSLGGQAGFGLQANRGSTITNFGLIQGGNGGSTGFGGPAVFLGGLGAVPSTLTNYGTIRGGDGGPTSGGYGVEMRLNGELINNGTIEGGNNAAGIAVQSTPHASIVNSGTILGGLTAGGRADAIATDATSSLNLELDAGSVINGNVVGSTTLNDTLSLGGSGTDNFDVSRIGATQQYRNFDTFEKTGTGTWILTGVGTTTTDWTVSDGTLIVGSTASDSVIGDITNQARLGGHGTIFGNLTNAGTITPGNSIGTLTIDGNYTSNGGTLEIETVLEDDTSPTDRLVVTGNTAGDTGVHVTNLGGTGAPTIEGIKIVDVGGVSDGTFTLQGSYVFQGDQAVVGGAYAYRLYKNGVSTPADGDWYLRSSLINPDVPPGTAVPPDTASAPLYQPGVPLYEAYPQLLLAMNILPTLQQRVGNRQWSGGGGSTALGTAAEGGWIRTEGMHGKVEPDSSTSATSYDYDFWKLQAGADGELYTNGNGTLIGGITAHYETLSGNINSVYGNGDVDTNGYGGGATLTWYGNDGFYADAQGQVTWYDSDLKSSLAGTMTNGNRGFGYALSLEAGKRFATSGPWSITPQAQLVYSSVDFDSFDDRFGARVSPGDGDSLIGRLGVALDREESWQRANGQTGRAKFYGIANLYGEALDGTTVDVSGAGFKSKNHPVWGGVTLGTSYDWNGDRFSLYGETAVKSSLKDFGDSYAVSGNVGLRVRW